MSILFRQPSAHTETAFLTPHLSGVWEYCESYKAAAICLYKHRMSGEAQHPDVTLPMMYLWRHYLELILKALIQSKREFDEPAPDHPHGHWLADLWRQLRGDQRSNDPEDQIIEETISEMDKADRESFAFRYPTDRKSQPSLVGLPPSFSLDNFHAQMIACSERLEVWFYRADHALERHRIWRAPAPQNLHDLAKEYLRASEEERLEILSVLTMKASYLSFPIPPQELAGFCALQLESGPTTNLGEALHRLKDEAEANFDP